jgi:hypothetical protein
MSAWLNLEVAARLEEVARLLHDELGIDALEHLDEPGVAELLAVDREYRTAAAAGTLPLIAPRRFNPGGKPWLPVLHTDHGARHYTALFSNTARAHALGRTHDWVVLYVDGGRGERQWTAVTARRGVLRGKRIIAGRELECARYYAGEHESHTTGPAEPSSVIGARARRSTARSAG